MHSYDPEKAARVWQRVHADEPAPMEADDLTTLISRVQFDGSCYLHLARQAGSRESAALKKLVEIKRSHADCLKGLCSMTAGCTPTVPTAQPPKETLRAALCRCCGSELRTLSQYELHSADREFGAVFTELAKEQRRCCKTLSELIGRLR